MVASKVFYLEVKTKKISDLVYLEKKNAFNHNFKSVLLQQKKKKDYKACRINILDSYVYNL